MYDFNHVGIPNEALQQSETWFDRDGNQHVIAEMNPNHAANAWNKLYKTYGRRGVSSPLGIALATQSATVGSPPLATTRFVRTVASNARRFPNSQI